MHIGVLELFFLLAVLFLMGIGLMVLLLRRPVSRHDAAVPSAPPSGVEAGPAIRRVFRSDRDRVLGGVCTGFAEYASIDPVIVRLIYVFVTILTGFVLGIFFYVVCVFIIPKRP